MAASLFQSPLSLILNTKSLHFPSISHPVFAYPPSLPSRTTSRKHSRLLSSSISPEPNRSWRLPANLGNFLLSEANPDEISQEIVSTADDGVSTVISALLFAAFIGLSILTIGVIYIGVTDFLQKREGEKLDKEEAAKKKKKGKKGKIRGRTRAGPRGFGQKMVEEDDDIDIAAAD